MTTNERERGTVDCDNCGKEHVAEYSHEGPWGQGAIYAVVCPQDDLTDFYQASRVTFSTEGK